MSKIRNINESGYARLMRTITGLVPAIDTFAIITWENPRSKKSDPEFNNKANEKLKRRLKDGNFSYRQIKGKFGTMEKPFMINNISRDQAMRLGKDGNQTSIVFGSKTTLNGNPAMKYEYIDFWDKSENATRYIWKNMKGADNFYSAYKGRKFVIPFFDDEYKDAQFVKKQDGFTIEKYDDPTDIQHEPTKLVAGHNIHYKHEYSEDVLTEINERIKKLMPVAQGVGMGAWGARGQINKILKENKK